MLYAIAEEQLETEENSLLKASSSFSEDQLFICFVQLAKCTKTHFYKLL
jgi:hypothetical protein